MSTGAPVPDEGRGSEIELTSIARRSPRRRRLLLVGIGAAVAVLVPVVVAFHLPDPGRGAHRIVPLGGSVTVLGEPGDPEPPPDSYAAVYPPPTAPPRPVAVAGESVVTPPQLVSVRGDAAAGTVTLTFDQPVLPGTGRYAALNVIFFESPTCAPPAANGQAFLEGAGTPTLILSMSYRSPGTAYVTVGDGVVTGVEGGLPNLRTACTAVGLGGPVAPAALGAIVDAAPGIGGGTVTVLFDRPVHAGDPTRLAVFADPACRNQVGGGASSDSENAAVHTGEAPSTGGSLSVTATGLTSGPLYVVAGAGLAVGWFGGLPNPASSCLAATSINPPVLVSATGDLAAGEVTLRFSRPVIGDPMVLQAMRLVVHRGPGCAGPAGNAHLYRRGAGTDTITVEATSLQAGTTYISIAAGFVTSADDGTRSRAVACYALPTG